MSEPMQETTKPDLAPDYVSRVTHLYCGTVIDVSNKGTRGRSL